MDPLNNQLCFAKKYQLRFSDEGDSDHLASNSVSCGHTGWSSSPHITFSLLYFLLSYCISFPVFPPLYFVSCISPSLQNTKYHLKLPQGNECGQSECGIYPTCQKTGQWEILEDCRRWNFFSAVSTYFSSGTSPALETLTLANFCKRTLNVQGTWSLPTSEEIWSFWGHPPPPGTGSRVNLGRGNVSTTTELQLVKPSTSQPPLASTVVPGVGSIFSWYSLPFYCSWNLLVGWTQCWILKCKSFAPGCSWSQRGWGRSLRVGGLAASG